MKFKPQWDSCDVCLILQEIDFLEQGVCVRCRDIRHAQRSEIPYILIWILSLLLACAGLYGYYLGNKPQEQSMTQVLEQMRHPRPMSQEHALYEVWGLTKADVEKPNDIFAEK